MNTRPLFDSKRPIVFILLLLFVATTSFSQEKNKTCSRVLRIKLALAFYNKQNGNLSISTDRHKYGKSALQWEWKGKSSFGTSNFKILTHKESPLKYGNHFPASPTLIMSLYNEVPQDGKITISYEKNGKQKFGLT